MAIILASASPRRKELLRRNGKRRVEHRFVLEVKAVVSNGRNFGRFDSKERVDARNRHIGARRFKAFGNSEAGVLFFVFGSCAFDFGADGFRRIRQRSESLRRLRAQRREGRILKQAAQRADLQPRF